MPAGCDRTGTLTVRGDGLRVRHSLESLGGSCRFQASVIRAEAPFEPVEDRTVDFSDDARIIDLSSLARLPQERIAIIQNVQGSANHGFASYTITRFCGGRQVAPLAPGRSSTPLQDGRYTVHAPHVPSFGAVATYPAVAAATDADTIVACSVTVALADLSAGCVVDGASSQISTWSAGQTTRPFDFEFDIRCGSGATTPTTTAATPATRTTQAIAAEDAQDMFEVAEDAEPASAEDAEPASAEPSDGPKFDMPTG